jgi:surface antigen
VSSRDERVGRHLVGMDAVDGVLVQVEAREAAWRRLSRRDRRQVENTRMKAGETLRREETREEGG